MNITLGLRKNGLILNVSLRMVEIHYLPYTLDLEGPKALNLKSIHNRVTYEHGFPVYLYIPPRGSPKCYENKISTQLSCFLWTSRIY